MILNNKDLTINDSINPWNDKYKSNFSFPLDVYEDLINYIYIEKKKFIDFWLIDNINVIDNLQKYNLVKYDWIWGFYLPFFSYVIKSLKKGGSDPILIGLSGLPGSGKSSFGNVAEKILNDINIPFKSISLDDFYLPSKEMELAMKGNPWNVPRGFPGSHSIDELKISLEDYLKYGILNVPQFDKSLRNGNGDRYGWINCSPKVVLLEGWFLGCHRTSSTTLNENIDRLKITNEEKEFRKVIQVNLCKYEPIWYMFDDIWHLKADNFNFTASWKNDQENEMNLRKGSSLKGIKLDNFIRMIKVALPQQSLQKIKSNYLIKINKNRQIIYSAKS